ncbi:MAG: hypothetical protein IT179_01040 [Acidobacteria bacterium]|nr:hypothetical protein [Acidobacteriota bacterium]
MTRLLSSIALALSLALGAAAAAAQNDVSGNWTLTINGPQGVIDSDATLKQDGEKVTGSFSGPAGDATVAGTMNGSTLALAFSVNTPEGVFDIKLSAEVNSTEMKGTLDYGMGVADFTGKRK